MTNNEITQGALVRIDHNAPGSLSAMRLMSDFIKVYGSQGVGIVLEDNYHYVIVLFSNGDKKYIHKTFLELLE